MLPNIASLNNPNGRIFPRITRSLYEAPEPGTKLPPEQLAAVKLLATPEKLARWRKYFTWRLDAGGRIARALLLHRNALLLEQESQWRRADFFWQALYTELASALANDAVWQSLADSLASENAGLEILADPSELRARFIEELLIDTHIAFYNGHAKSSEAPAADSRAWKHLDYLAKLLDWSELSSADKLSLIDAATQAHVSVLANAGRWTEARQLCSLLVQFDPESVAYQEQLTSVYFSEGLAQFGLNGDKQGAAKTQALFGGIKWLQGLQAEHWLSLVIFQTVSDLYCRLANSLADSGQVSAALVAAQKAVTFNPASPDAAAVLTKLTETMNSMQEYAKDLTVSRATRVKENGPFLFDEVRIGFAPLDEYKRSAEVSQIAEAFNLARAITLWRKIGLQTRGKRDVECALKLLTAVDSLIADPPARKEELHPAWLRLAGADADLEQLDHSAVCAFLEHELWQDPAPQGCSARPDEYFPLLASNTPRPTQLREPFAYWLLGRNDLRPKLRALAAIILLATVGVLFIKDARARSIRSTSYQQIIQATNNRDYRQVVEGAETFLSHPVLLVEDERETEVINYYNRALVLWVARQPGALQPDTVSHIARYQQLTGTAK